MENIFLAFHKIYLFSKAIPNRELEIVRNWEGAELANEYLCIRFLCIVLRSGQALLVQAEL